MRVSGQASILSGGTASHHDACGTEFKVASTARGKVSILLRELGYEDPTKIDHDRWTRDAAKFKEVTRDTPCDDVEDSRQCYARIASVYASPESR